MNINPGKLVIVTGFSGAGKDTLIDLFLQKRSDYEAVVTHSTRPQRPGEIPDVHHHFVKDEEFETLIQNGEMLEYVKYGSYYKGTSKNAFVKITEGINIIWRIDILRAATYEETFSRVFDTKTTRLLNKRSIRLFIKTPTYHVALDRYIKREKNDPDIKEFEKRMKRDTIIYKEHRHKFQHTIVNRSGKINEALLKMERIIDSY